MTRRPRIGVTVSARGSTLTWLCHWFALWRAGARAVRLAAGGRTGIDGLDGLVIGGGDDIGADLYGGEVLPTVRTDPPRDRLEMDLLAKALERRLPVLGICRGAQLLNVHLGGTLHGDIHKVYDGVPRLRTVLPRKSVTVTEGSRLAALVGGGTRRVNSLHHQSVDRLGKGLRVVARDGHGIVQAVENPDAPFLIGVQWHPEFLIFQRDQRGLYRGLVEAARKSGRG